MRDSQPRSPQLAPVAIRSRRKVFLRDMSALVPRQQSPLPPDEIRDHVSAFFVRTKSHRTGAGAVPNPTATPTPTLTSTTLERLRIVRPALQLFRRNKISITRVVTVIVAMIAGWVTFRETFGQTTAYTVSELSAGVPCRLNNLGDVAGNAGDPSSGEIGAVLWYHGRYRVPKHLGKLQGGDHGSASGINDAGEVAGKANTAESIVPFVWTPRGGLRRCPLLAGDNCGQAFGINRHRHVVGYSSGPNGRRGFLWTRGGRVRDLGVLPGGDHSSAFDINDLDEGAWTSGSAAGDR